MNMIDAKTPEKAWAIILAAGSGLRMGRTEPKQFINWRSRPLYWHSARVFSRCACMGGLVFVFPKQYLEREKEEVARLYNLEDLGLPYKIAAGGATRLESSRLGLLAVPLSVQKVLVHDAARPFVTPGLIWRIHDAISKNHPCVIPALPVTDTIKLTTSTEPDLVEATLPRNRLASVQTPQGFVSDILRKAHDLAHSENVTDDAMLVEQLGEPVRLVPGERGNIKLTTPEDLKFLEEENLTIPVSGFGYDAHKFGGERPLKLGGVQIPGNYGVCAHSDGDVLLHALMDAILGAASLGDIGLHFPDSDPKFKGINSAILLSRVMDLVAGQDMTLAHVDLTVVAQKPRLRPYAEEIRGNVARMLALEKGQVNFKATTEEGLGYTGRMEGIKAYALVNGLKQTSR